jgi:predicted flap endonuclease-1-like 5' DNA nuclease
MRRGGFRVSGEKTDVARLCRRDMLRCNMNARRTGGASFEERSMAWTHGFPSAAVVDERAERALRWPIGAVSPLWAMFGAAASAGVAWWWLTRWTQAANVEALAGYAAEQTKQAVEAAADAQLRVEEAVVAADAAVADVRAPVAQPDAAPAAAKSAAANDAMEATSDDVADAAEPAADDLMRLTGIGPKLAAALAERGVTRFAQIAAWSADDLAEADAALSLKGRAVREAWVAQAKRFAKAAAKD